MKIGKNREGRCPKSGPEEPAPPDPDAKIPDLESRMVATPPRSIIMAEYALYVMLDSVF